MTRAFVLQVWLCGGSIEVIPCSKIAHVERAVKPYLPNLSTMVKRNALRVAEVWLDEYKPNVNIGWNLPLEVRARSRLKGSFTHFLLTLILTKGWEN